MVRKHETPAKQNERLHEKSCTYAMLIVFLIDVFPCETKTGLIRLATVRFPKEEVHFKYVYLL